MNTRDLWIEIMNYGEFDRMPVVHWCGWAETRERWLDEGLPEDANEHEFFDAVPQMAGVGANLDLYPLLDNETLEDTDEYQIFRDGYGVVQQDWKNKSCIPHYIDFTLKGPDDWPEFKKRLQPDPKRISRHLPKHLAAAEASGSISKQRPAYGRPAATCRLPPALQPASAPKAPISCSVSST